jgi:hypothetical protein
LGSISKNLSFDEGVWLKLKELIQKIEDRKIESDSEICQLAFGYCIEALEKKLAKEKESKTEDSKSKS